MKIKFLGAAGTVTGSCFVLTSEQGNSIMVDCGLFQGSKELDRANFLPFEFDCTQLQGVVLTHAHLDHCGRLPLLLGQGFHGSIWMTNATRDITEISLLDTAKINMEDNPDHPLYETEDVNALLELCKTVEYGQTFSVSDFSVVMRDAGHILGSASLEVIDTRAKQQLKKIIFSGDLGNTPEDLIQPTYLIDDGDVAVMESTYGDRVHPSDNPVDALQAEINAIEKNGGTLLIPAFAIERSQELLHHIAHLKRDGKVKKETLVFFDSPMAERVTEVFDKYPELYNAEFAAEAKQGTPFHFPGLEVVENRGAKNALAEMDGTKVIIAGSGMMTGGRILAHAQQYLPLESTRLFFVGYQAEGTLGRALLEGRKSIVLKGVPVQVNATITQTQALSSHADQPKLLNWVQHIQGLKKVFIVHGEDSAREALMAKIKTEIQVEEVVLPKPNDVIQF